MVDQNISIDTGEETYSTFYVSLPCCNFKFFLELDVVPVIYIDSVFMILPWNLYVADSILPFVQMLGRNIFMKLVSKILVPCELQLQN